MKGWRLGVAGRPVVQSGPLNSGGQIGEVSNARRREVAQERWLMRLTIIHYWKSQGGKEAKEKGG